MRLPLKSRRSPPESRLRRLLVRVCRARSCSNSCLPLSPLPPAPLLLNRNSAKLRQRNQRRSPQPRAPPPSPSPRPWTHILPRAPATAFLPLGCSPLRGSSRRRRAHDPASGMPLEPQHASRPCPLPLSSQRPRAPRPLSRCSPHGWSTPPLLSQRLLLATLQLLAAPQHKARARRRHLRPHPLDPLVVRLQSVHLHPERGQRPTARPCPPACWTCWS